MKRLVIEIKIDLPEDYFGPAPDWQDAIHDENI